MFCFTNLKDDSVMYWTTLHIKIQKDELDRDDFGFQFLHMTNTNKAFN